MRVTAILGLISNTAPVWDGKRGYASAAEEDLKDAMKRVIPGKRELLKKVKALSDKKLGDVKVENTLGGMRCVS